VLKGINEHLRKYNTMATVFSAFLVAGSFLYSSTEIIIMLKIGGLLLFFCGFFGILYFFFAGISEYSLKSLADSVEKSSRTSILHFLPIFGKNLLAFIVIYLLFISLLSIIYFMWDISQHFGTFVDFTLRQNTTAIAVNKGVTDMLSLFCF